VPEDESLFGSRGKSKISDATCDVPKPASSTKETWLPVAAVPTRTATRLPAPNWLKLGNMTRLAVIELTPVAPVIVTDVEVATLVVVIENVVLVAPDGIVTDDGTTADPLFELSVIVVPAGGAAVDIDTVPVLDRPPITDPGDTDIVATVFIATYLASKFAKYRGPHPESVSHPVVAVEVALFGKVPFVPDVMS